jgi:hypothetical protein
MRDVEPHFDSALKAANIALSGSKRREDSRFASIELRFSDRRAGAWEIAAASSVALAAVVLIAGAWFL